MDTFRPVKHLRKKIWKSQNWTNRFFFILKDFQIALRSATKKFKLKYDLVVKVKVKPPWLVTHTSVGEKQTRIIFSWETFHSHSFALTLRTNCYFTKSKYARSTVIVTDLRRMGVCKRKFKSYQIRSFTLVLYYLNFCNQFRHIN